MGDDFNNNFLMECGLMIRVWMNPSPLHRLQKYLHNHSMILKQREESVAAGDLEGQWF